MSAALLAILCFPAVESLKASSTTAWWIAEDAGVLGSRRAERASWLRVDRLDRELSKCRKQHARYEAAISASFDARTLKKRKLALRDKMMALERAFGRLRPHVRERRLGSGATGEVYAAWSTERHEACAAKVARGAARAALRSEYDMLRRLDGAGGCFPRPRYFADDVPACRLPRSASRSNCSVLIMDRLGPSLEDLLFACTCGCAGFSDHAVLAVAGSLLRSLEALCDVGVVHGDVKPDNVLVALGDPGRLCLVDFGAALDVGAPRAHGFQGTRGFASRGALAGRPAAAADDCESLGHTLRYLLTGSHEGVEPQPSPAVDFAQALLGEARRALRANEKPDYARLAQVLDDLRIYQTQEETLDWVRLGVSWDDEGLICHAGGTT